MNELFFYTVGQSHWLWHGEEAPGDEVDLRVNGFIPVIGAIAGRKTFLDDYW